MAKTSIRIADLYRFQLVSDPQLSPDGRQVAFVVERMHRKDREYYSHLFLVGFDGRHLRQLTFGKRQDHTPRWSPDGQTLAFIRKEQSAGQIWLLPLTGGEARPLTRLPRGRLSYLTWSPDGREIAFLFHPLGKEVTVGPDGKPETPVVRHIKDLWYRLDGEGYFDSEFTHVWVADVRTGRVRQLVDGNFHDSFPCWSPDGGEIAFISQRFEDWQYRLEEQHVYVVPARGGTVEQLPAPDGPKEGLAWSPDGTTLAYLGHQRPYHSWGAVNYLLNTITRDGSRHCVYGEVLDRTAYPLTIGDITPSFVVSSPTWSPDGKAVYYLISSEGRQLILRLDLATDTTVPVSAPDDVAITWSLNRDGTRLVYHGATLEGPDELAAVELNSGTIRPLTRLNRPYLRLRAFRPAEEVWFANGEQRLQGWLVKPPDFDPQRRYPMILNIHGGPRGQYGRTFFHEMQVLAARGYLVFYTNPRGSQGYGEAFADAITGKWAEPAMEDLMAAVDYVLALGFVDENRLGVTGGSYGGYMTNWIVTHTDRFAAAVTQRSVSDLASMFGTSDVGWDMHYEFDGTPWEKREEYRRWSPLTYVENCRTPLLIIHSEGDLRCNIEQADQLFTALKYLKREVEYVRFPEEFHGLSRHGRPDRRERRLRYILEWFDKYLRGEES
jgi:dipeptidyl aminopeptidase/acylaminoacyl peptidase